MQKIGIISPTYNRPDFIRLLALQLENQNIRPDFVAFYQNGTPDSYEWAIKDIKHHYKYVWLHEKEKINQEEWYATPLEFLIKENCTHFFWCDHDDIYEASHIKKGMEKLNDYDYSVNKRSNLLLLKNTYEYFPNQNFTAHDPGGMSSSMCFNRAFAEELVKDLRNNAKLTDGKLCFADQVVKRVTMPKFNCLVNEEDATTTYVCHPKTVSSSHWLA